MDGKVLPPDDFDAQAKMVMANLTKALAAGGPRSIRRRDERPTRV